MSDNGFNQKRGRGAEWLRNHPWLWIPGVMLTRFIPWVILLASMPLFLLRCDMTNADIFWYVSLLWLPWLLKPVWVVILDRLPSHRIWFLIANGLMVMGLFLLSSSLTASNWLTSIMLCLWLISFSGSILDTIVDDAYPQLTSGRLREAYSGVMCSFYRVVVAVVLGIFVMVAGNIEVVTRKVVSSWASMYYSLALISLLLFMINFMLVPMKTVRLDEGKRNTATQRLSFRQLCHTLCSPFGSWSRVIFLMLYPLPVILTERVALIFFSDAGHTGGLGLSPQETAFVFGVVGILSQACGGIIGGMLVHRHGVGRWKWFMALAVGLPQLIYALISRTQPTDITLLSSLVAMQQMCCGFGLVVYALMVVNTNGDRLGMAVSTSILPFMFLVAGLYCGTLQESVGYYDYFLLVSLTSLLPLIVTALTSVPSILGKRYGVK